MKMCDCIPDHIRYNFRCKKRNQLSFLGIRFQNSLEFTIIHFWLYMIFLGVVIAFILKSLGFYLQHRTKTPSSECSLKKSNPVCAQNISSSEDCCEPNINPSNSVSICKSTKFNDNVSCETIRNKSPGREGIKLLLNNKFEEAKELFRSENEDIQMAAGYCFLTFMNALMTFEEGKLEESLQTLKDIEKRCSQDFGWLKSVKNKVLSTFNYNDEDLAEKLEKQIILADSHLCVALLTFLHQDLTSYVKGGWVLMKAWKVYLDTYTQIFALYKKTFACDESIPGLQQPSWETVRKSASSVSLATASAISKTRQYSVPNTPNDDIVGLKIPPSASNSTNGVTIEPYVVARLMAAVSFGYGIFQLCISLLPSSFLKLIQFLGFEGGREAGLSALMFSREGDDMRGPLALLTLLWYHTIVRPFFAVDGANVQAGVNEAEALINESEEEFGDSALFLFFKGRVQRLKSNIPESLKAYESAIEKSSQREVQLLCLHEVGWCYLIQLDWGNAFHCFNQLRTRSKWSQGFYTYLDTICMGALGDSEQAHRLAEEIPNLLNEESAVPQIKTFITRRIRKFNPPPSSSTDGENPLNNKLSCELLLLELLYFWNALPSCHIADVKNILEECETIEKEPMPGLIYLLDGALHLCASDLEKAIVSFRNCLEKRRELKLDSRSDSDGNDNHIPAFASFELASILIQKQETLEEGKDLLLQAQNNYKDYDFEYRLTIRINSLLKKIN